MSTGKIFVHDNIEYKLYRVTYEESCYGYVDTETVDDNVLSQRIYVFGIKTPFWKEIDRERIPSHAIISLGCFGDTGGWTGRLYKKYLESRF